MHDTSALQARAEAPRWWRRFWARTSSFAGTIRGRILIAFLAMSLITGAVGGYAALCSQRASALVTKTFDQSLMSINYARAASADFAAIRAAFVRRWFATDSDERGRLDQQIETLEQSLADDLGIAAERSHSERAVRAAEDVREAIAAWDGARRRLFEGTDPVIGLRLGSRPTWDELDQLAASVDQRIDLLINYTAGDGFTYRQSARAAVAEDLQRNLVGTGLALVVSGLVTWLLARRITRPVADASAVAARIARGDLDGVIPQGSADELGALLASMGLMRDNIRTMMAREVAQRRSAEGRLADALESSREGVVVVDADDRIGLANAQAADFLGLPPERLPPGTPVAALLSPPHLAGTRAALLALSAGATSQGEVRLPDGRWLRVSRSPTQEGGFIVVQGDITQLKVQEEVLWATNLRLDAALDNMSQGLCLYDAQHRLKVVNRQFCALFGLCPETVRPGLHVSEVLALKLAAGHYEGRSLAELLAERDAVIGQRTSGTYLQDLSGGRVVAIAHQPTADGGWVATYEDITERRTAEAQIVFMARHDALTDLPNRVLFGERIEQALAEAGRGAGFAVLCLDLDHFKQVNDTLGHPVGDELLRAVAERLKACVREVDTVARLGGDEFAIIQRGIGGPNDVALLARRIVEVVSAEYDLDGHRITVGVSIGISLAPGDGTLGPKLLKNADVALYRAKAEGRGTWRFFEAEMDARLQARRLLELDLREALGAEAFDLHYQPLYDLRQGRIGGFEALLRWPHPVRGMISPADFVPLAEEIGMIVPLGEWVLRRACAEAARWPDDVMVAVNVSAVQFKSPRLVQAVAEALSHSGLPPHRLELEITESVLLANSVETLAILYRLRDLGLRIAMDDFGTGYSSLSYLRSFPFDKIKIDRSFIRDVAENEEAALIVRTIVGLGSSLGMVTTAEGVETEAQLQRLSQAGCDQVQGYLFSPPAPAAQVRTLIDRWAGRLAVA